MVEVDSLAYNISDMWIFTIKISSQKYVDEILVQSSKLLKVEILKHI